MSGEDKTPDVKQSEPWTGLLKSAIGQLIPLVLTGASLVGFVAFAGAVIVWTRFYAIEVPQDQAVKAVPQAELVATGSSVLLLFGFFGVLAIVAAYLVDRSGRATPGMSRALLILLAVEGAAAIVIFDSSWDGRTAVAILVFVLLAMLALLATFHESVARYVDELPSRANETLGPRRGAGPLRTETNERRASPGEIRSLAGSLAIVVVLVALALVSPSHRLDAVLAGALLVVVVFAFLKPWKAGRKIADGLLVEWRAGKTEEEEQRGKQEAARTRREKAERERVEKCTETEEPSQKSKVQLEREREAACAKEREAMRRARRRPHRLRITWFGIVVLAALGAAAIVVPSLAIGSRWLAVPLGAAMVLGLGVWRIAVLSKPTFMWFGFAVFLSVPLFGTLTLMAHNISNPQVQPVALIRSSDGPDEAIQGIYVTEGSDRVYFANVATEGCSDNIKPHSGRLLWVPKSEVVAMSIGPLQDVEDAGRSALEMAYALTPSVETPAAGAVSLTVPEERSQKLIEAEEARLANELETRAPQLDQRLENPGPAVRPNFGSGLSLVPEVASPGKEVELRLSAPNEDVNGFGAAPNGHTLRLNGVPLTPLREATPDADRAEYVKTEGGVLLSLDKQGVYGLSEAHRPYPLGEGSTHQGPRYVKLEDSRATVVHGDPPHHPEYLRVVSNKKTGIAELAGARKVMVGRGQAEALEPGFLRQDWSRDRIRFRVPDASSSGVVTVDCGQLAGSPLLRVSRAPTARILVRMRENSTGVKLDSSGSRDSDGEKITRRWTIEGLGRGHRRQIATRLPPRLGAYVVKLTVTDKAGNTDTAELRLLRLPTSLLKLKGAPKHREEIEAAAEALDDAVRTRPPKAIELDAHTDHSGSPSLNMKLSFEKDDRVAEMLLRKDEDPPPGETAIPVREVAYGKTCPVDPRDGSRPRNRRVDVFVLDEGVTVKPPKGCVPGRLRSTSWYPRPAAEDKASASSSASTSPLNR